MQQLDGMGEALRDVKVPVDLLRCAPRLAGGQAQLMETFELVPLVPDHMVGPAGISMKVGVLMSLLQSQSSILWSRIRCGRDAMLWTGDDAWAFLPPPLCRVAALAWTTRHFIVGFCACRGARARWRLSESCSQSSRPKRRMHILKRPLPTLV